MATRYELMDGTCFPLASGEDEFLGAAREFVSNALDAQTEYGAKMQVAWARSGHLVISNFGCVIPEQALLLGWSSKRSRKDMIGKFGTGLKLGGMWAYRSGHPVEIQNGNKIWRFVVEPSVKYANAKVLVCIETERSAGSNAVQIKVPCTQLEWEKLKARFLDASPPKSVIKTDHGWLLLDPEHQGKFFVKGVWVSDDNSLAFGYNFTQDVELDHERQMVDYGPAREAMKRITETALAQRPDLFRDKFLDALENDASDESSTFRYAYVERETKEAVKTRFFERHGEGAVPVRSLGEARDLEHHGRKGILVNETINQILRDAGVQSAVQVLASCANDTAKVWGWNDLTQDERNCLTYAQTLAEKAFPDLELDCIEVVDFKLDKWAGMYRSPQKIQISRKALASVPSALGVLIHERSHAAGKDLTEAHTQAIESAWQRVAEHLIPTQ
jgi:hypothetical protein